ncbi:hypothetical protein [Thermostaphylospora chromogena]|uniref:hypothetical protein n=1 Tax=Thermostaphylospora chromogena TaxID=35622 RepID=UPI003BFA3900
MPLRFSGCSARPREREEDLLPEASAFEDAPMRRGVRPRIRPTTPKPNSALREPAGVRSGDGAEATACIPGCRA